MSETQRSNLDPWLCYPFWLISHKRYVPWPMFLWNTYLKSCNWPFNLPHYHAIIMLIFRVRIEARILPTNRKPRSTLVSTTLSEPPQPQTDGLNNNIRFAIKTHIYARTEFKYKVLGHYLACANYITLYYTWYLIRTTSRNACTSNIITYL